MKNMTLKEITAACGVIYYGDEVGVTNNFENAKKYVDNFLNTPFAGGRHIKRVEKMTSIR